MDSYTIYAHKMLSPAGWREDCVVAVEDGAISDVRRGATGDYTAQILAPGYFDLHNHGGAGFDPSSCSFDDLEIFLKQLAACGVTDLLMTTAPSNSGDIRKVFGFVEDAMEMQESGGLGGACIRGVHMEGPFLNPARPGAINPKHMLTPSPATFDKLYGDYMDIIDLVTLAPEVEGGAELAKWLIGNGIKVQAGHTDATYEQALDAFSIGVDSLCHTFNAARPIHHRDPGVVAAALYSPNVYCEAICDLEHLHPGALRLIYQCKGARRVTAISDSTSLHGLPDGEYKEGGHSAVVKNGVARTLSGSLSGGGCHLDKSVRNLANIVGIPLEDALTMAGRTPAVRMGYDVVGEIEVGRDADLVALTTDLLVGFSVVRGEIYNN